MKSIIFYLLGSIALVIPSSDLPKDFREKIHAHLPGVVRQVEVERTQGAASSSKLPNLKDAGQFRNLEADLTKTVPGDALHLAYAMARKEWLKEAIFPVHSACVGNKRTGYFLLVGESGAGKSTTALTLIANYGALLFSGDKTLIQMSPTGKIKAIAGTQVMTTRPDSDLGPFKEIIEPDSMASTRSDRSTFRLRGDFVVEGTAVDIQTIYLIRAYHTVERRDELHFPTSLFLLFSHFVDQEREDVILGLGARLFQGDLPLEVKERNMKQITSGIRATRVVNVTGSLEYVAREIAQDRETAVSLVGAAAGEPAATEEGPKP